MRRLASAPNCYDEHGFHLKTCACGCRWSYNDGDRVCPECGRP